MNNIADKLLKVQEYALSIRPKVGGFPILAEAFREAGIILNRWCLPSCQSIYIMNDGAVVQQGTPIINGTHEIPKFHREALIVALRTDQEGRSSFPEFLLSAWKAGVTSYEVHFLERKVIYFGALGESYEEKYPAIELKK